MVLTKSLTHCNTVAYKQRNFTLYALLSGKIIVTQTTRLNHSDIKPFKAQIIATQQIITTQQRKVYNSKRRYANGLA